MIYADWELHILHLDIYINTKNKINRVPVSLWHISSTQIAINANCWLTTAILFWIYSILSNFTWSFLGLRDFNIGKIETNTNHKKGVIKLKFQNRSSLVYHHFVSIRQNNLQRYYKKTASTQRAITQWHTSSYFFQSEETILIIYIFIWNCQMTQTQSFSFFVSIGPNMIFLPK